MQYHISRGGETYGPYPEEMVREMVSEGRVAPSDLCWAGDMEGWLPVSLVFGLQAATAQKAEPVELREGAPQAATALAEAGEEAPREPPEAAHPSATPSATGEEHRAWEMPAAPAGESAPSPPLPVAVPEAWRRAKERREAPPELPLTGLVRGFPEGLVPPDLHWAIVLALSYATCGLFLPVWLLVQLSFVKRLDPKNPAATLILGSIAAVLASYFTGIFGGGTLAARISSGLFWAGIAQVMGAALLMRRSLLLHYNTVEKMGLQLNPALTCIFSALYFQYHFSRIAKWKKTWRMG